MSLSFRYPDKPHTASLDFLDHIAESEWLAQAKYDGWRMPTYINDTSVECFSRANRKMETATKGQFDQRIYDYFLTLDAPDNTVFDTEFVGPRGSLPTAVYIFDCLAWSGQWLTNVPFEDRWNKCLGFKRIIDSNDLLHLSETADTNFKDYFERLKQGWYNIGCIKEYPYEGIILKRRNGNLILDIKSSKKSNSLFKIKFRDIAEPRY